MVEEISGGVGTELALCYYKHRGDKEPAGWFFLKDVSEIEEEVSVNTKQAVRFVVFFKLQKSQCFFVWRLKKSNNIKLVKPFERP